jgi:hypothetical protein
MGGESGAPAIPHCRSLSLLGERAAGTLYAADSDRYGGAVTVTVYPRPVDDESQRRFEAAVETARRLGAHPNIVTIHASGHTADGQPYVVSDGHDRTTAQGVLATAGALGLDAVLPIGVALAGALETAHRAGIVHGGVSPSVILLRADGQPVLTEAGLSDFARPLGASAAMARWIPYHAPPEILEGTDVSPATDVYSLASVVYTLLVGQPPHAGTGVDDSTASLLLRILQMSMPPLGRSDVPPGFEDALRSALSHSPAKRPRHASELAWAMQDAQRMAGLGVSEPVVLDLAAGGGGAAPATPAGNGSPGWTALGAAGAVPATPELGRPQGPVAGPVPLGGPVPLANGHGDGPIASDGFGSSGEQRASQAPVDGESQPANGHSQPDAAGDAAPSNGNGRTDAGYPGAATPLSGAPGPANGDSGAITGYGAGAGPFDHTNGLTNGHGRADTGRTDSPPAFGHPAAPENGNGRGDAGNIGGPSPVGGTAVPENGIGRPGVGIPGGPHPLGTAAGPTEEDTRADSGFPGGPAPLSGGIGPGNGNEGAGTGHRGGTWSGSGDSSPGLSGPTAADNQQAGAAPPDAESAFPSIGYRPSGAPAHSDGPRTDEFRPPGFGFAARPPGYGNNGGPTGANPAPPDTRPWWATPPNGTPVTKAPAGAPAPAPVPDVDLGPANRPPIDPGAPADALTRQDEQPRPGSLDSPLHELLPSDERPPLDSRTLAQAFEPGRPGLPAALPDRSDPRRTHDLSALPPTPLARQSPAYPGSPVPTGRRGADQAGPAGPAGPVGAFDPADAPTRQERRHETRDRRRPPAGRPGAIGAGVGVGANDRAGSALERARQARLERQRRELEAGQARPEARAPGGGIATAPGGRTAAGTSTGTATGADSGSSSKSSSPSGSGPDSAGSPRRPIGATPDMAVARTGPPAMPVIVLVMVVVVLGIGGAWMVVTGEDSARPASDAPEASGGDDPNGSGAESGSSTTAAAPPGSQAAFSPNRASDLTAVETSAGVQLDWEGPEGIAYLIRILSPTEPPRPLGGGPATALLVPADMVQLGGPYCFDVVAAPEDGAPPVSVPSDPTEVVFPTACVGGAAPESVIRP